MGTKKKSSSSEPEASDESEKGEESEPEVMPPEESPKPVLKERSPERDQRRGREHERKSRRERERKEASRSRAKSSHRHRHHGDKARPRSPELPPPKAKAEEREEKPAGKGRKDSKGKGKVARPPSRVRCKICHQMVTSHESGQHQHRKSNLTCLTWAAWSALSGEEQGRSHAWDRCTAQALEQQKAFMGWDSDHENVAKETDEESMATRPAAGAPLRAVPSRARPRGEQKLPKKEAKRNKKTRESGAAVSSSPEVVRPPKKSKKKDSSSSSEPRRKSSHRRGRVVITVG